MNIEAVICQSLDYACSCGWDSPKQKELAASVGELAGRLQESVVNANI